MSTAPSAMSSPAMLGIKEHRDSTRDYQRAQSAMQFYNYQGDGTIHKKQYTGKQRLRLDRSPLSGTDILQRSGPLSLTIASLLAGPSGCTQGGGGSGATRQTAVRHQPLPTRRLVGSGGSSVHWRLHRRVSHLTSWKLQAAVNRLNSRPIVTAMFLMF